MVFPPNQSLLLRLVKSHETRSLSILEKSLLRITKKKKVLLNLFQVFIFSVLTADVLLFQAQICY